MRIWIFLFFAICLQGPAFSMPEFSSANSKISEQKSVRVRLEKKLDAILIKGFAVQILNKKNNSIIYSNSRLSSLKIKSLKNNSILQLQINTPDGEKTLQVDQDIMIRGADLRKGLQELPQMISVLQKESQLDLVGYYPIETYLVGVLAGEIPLSWPDEALKTQAIAARTYVLSMMDERRFKDYDVENSILDQMFKSINQKQKKSKSILRAKKAIQETEGFVLVDKNNRIKKIYFHADCGGQTTSEKKVWGTGSVVMAQSCPGNHDSGWNFSISKDEAMQNLKARLGENVVFDQIQAVRPSQVERVDQIDFYLNKNKVASLGANLFREALGFSRLKSTQFEISNQGNEFRFRGRGWGHGVGLCQLGAKAMAQAGRTTNEILSFYYPDRHLLKDQSLVAQFK